VSDPVRILLVEDNPADARLVQQTLLDSSAGETSAWFQLRVAERLSAGLDVLSAGDVDVVLLDLSLPDSEGLNTLTSFSTRAPALPIVVMTGLEDESVAVRALQAGAQDYLIKGQSDPGLLVRAIRYAIERKRTQEALWESQRQLQALNETLEHKVRERTAEVRSLASDLTKAEQRERRRISHILHDDLQQRLYAIKIQMAMVLEMLGTENSPVQAELAEVREQIDLALALTRRLSIDLSPPILKDEGLEQAIQWLAAQMQEQHGLHVVIQAAGAVPIPDSELQVLLFNCVRELLFNVVKHARVSEAIVSLERTDGDLRIEVCDYGKGFNPGRLAQGNGASEEGAFRARNFGLPTLRHRLSLFGGNMEVDSTPGSGTRVTLTIPISPESVGPEERRGK
jgi:signal transduction histidine kinase